MAALRALLTLLAILVGFAGSAAAASITAFHQIEGYITAAQWDSNPHGRVYPFSVGDSFEVTATYTYDPALFPEDFSLYGNAARLVNFSYQFSVGVLTLQSHELGCVYVRQTSLLSTGNFGFWDEVPLVFPGFSEVPVDVFYLSPLTMAMALMAGDGTRGQVDGVVTSSTMSIQPVPEPSSLLLLASALTGLALRKKLST